MSHQILGVVSDVEHIEITSTPRKNWLMLGALGLAALLILTTRGKGR